MTVTRNITIHGFIILIIIIFFTILRYSSWISFISEWRRVRGTPPGGERCRLMTYDVNTGLGNQMFAFASTLGISRSFEEQTILNQRQGRYGSWCVCIESTSMLRSIFPALSDWPACSANDITSRNTTSIYTHRSYWARYIHYLARYFMQYCLNMLIICIIGQINKHK